MDLSFGGNLSHHAWHDMMSDALLSRSPSKEQGALEDAHVLGVEVLT